MAQAKDDQIVQSLRVRIDSGPYDFRDLVPGPTRWTSAAWSYGQMGASMRSSRVWRTFTWWA